jgi:hypothetical protein
MTQLDPGINLKNPKKQDEVPKWYGWTGHKPGSGFSDMPRPTLGVFASLDRF